MHRNLSTSLGLLLLVICVLSSTWVYAEERDGLVVWRLEAKTGVSENDIDSLTGIISAEVEKQSGKKVISETDIQTILRGEETKQNCGAESDNCIAEIGAALGVPEVVAGDLGRVGGIYVLNLRRINVRTAEVIKRISRQVEGSLTDLVKIVPQAAADLFGNKTDSGVSQGEMSVYEKAAYGTFFSGLGVTVIGFVGMSQMKAAKDDGDKSSFNGWKGATIACWTIGGAAMVTGAALWIVDAVKKKNGEPNEPEPVSFGIAPQKDGVAASLLVRW